MRIILFQVSILLLFLSVGEEIQAQKKPIDTLSYHCFKRIDSYALSDNGQWTIFRYIYNHSYEDSKSLSDIYYIHNNETGEIDSLVAEYPRFIANGKYLCYTNPQKQQIELYELVTKKIRVIEGVEQIEDYEDSSYISYTLGDTTCLENVVLDKCWFLPNHCCLKKCGKDMFMTLHRNKKAHVVTRISINDGVLTYKDVFVDTTKTLSYFLYYSHNDRGVFSLKNKNIQLKYIFNSKGEVKQLFDERYIKCDLKYSSWEVINEGQWIELSMPRIKTSRKKHKGIERDSSFELELWSWNDYKIPSQQQHSGSKSYSMSSDKYIYNPQTQRVVQLSNRAVGNMYYPTSNDVNYVLFVDETPYITQKDWIYVGRYDWYIINLETGEKKVIGKKQSKVPMWCPKVEKLLVYCDISKVWSIYDPNKDSYRSLSKEIPYPHYNELHDRPNPAPVWGVAGWSENGERLYLYDRYDIWRVDLKDKKRTVCITKGYGRKHKIQVRLLSDDPIHDFNEENPLEVKLLYWDTKEQGLGWLHKGKINEKCRHFASLRVAGRSKDGSYYLLDRQNFEDGRDLWIYDSQQGDAKKVSSANPDHNGYAWGSVKLVSWINYEGVENQGVLYLPPNYDESKKYPTIVNFYETHSNEVHSYFTPAWCDAMLNIPNYLSMGYIIFQPDVHFKVGTPAKSSYNAVVSGTDELIRRGIIDSLSVGLQGHSWSGFQVAHLVTQTDLFTCVNIGAPITNMVGAYTGIREESGIPRMFMYEDWQCRMGSTLWENKQGYIENSSIFYADQVTTPVLIFHCDKDGAVSFYDGRNFFLALRRLQKPVWLLNYKGEGHFVTSNGARRDWTKRMQQFFDYYLKKTAIPRWMSEGITVEESGYDQKYDLLNN